MKKYLNSLNIIAIFISCICMVGLASLKTKPKSLIDKAVWLIGTWENNTNRGSIYESWEIINELELAGKSYMVKDKDTVVFETIKIVEEQNTLFYIPTVMDQNDQKPVRFKLKSHTDNEFIFENKQHDFPQVITYRKINSDSLVAEISGVKNGLQKGSRFAMSRFK